MSYVPGHGAASKFNTTTTVHTTQNIVVVPNMKQANTLRLFDTSVEGLLKCSFKKNKLGKMNAIVNAMVAPSIVHTIIIASKKSPIVKLETSTNVVSQNLCFGVCSHPVALLISSLHE